VVICLFIFGLLVVWGSLGAIGVQCYCHRKGQWEWEGAKGDSIFFIVLAAPIRGPLEIVRWILWRSSERGKLEIEKRNVERAQKRKDLRDDILDDLEV
jgi:hypothetical protein